MTNYSLRELTPRAISLAKELDAVLYKITQEAEDSNNVTNEFHAKGAKYLAEQIIIKLNAINQQCK